MVARLGWGFAGAMAMLMTASACSALSDQGSAIADPDGCNPQVAAGYRIMSTMPTGVLEIRVQDASGSPVASAGIQLTRLVYTGLRCPSIMDATTNASGVARLERMKTGPYSMSLHDSNATASTEVKANETVLATLVK